MPEGRRGSRRRRPERDPARRGNTAFGQHFSYATPAVPWCEYFAGTPPGVPPEEGQLPGQRVPRDGWLVPSDAPGFGLEMLAEWLTPFFGS